MLITHVAVSFYCVIYIHKCLSKFNIINLPLCQWLTHAVFNTTKIGSLQMTSVAPHYTITTVYISNLIIPFAKVKFKYGCISNLYQDMKCFEGLFFTHQVYMINSNLKWVVLNLIHLYISLMRTWTSWLVKINILSFIEPIREGVRKWVCLEGMMRQFQSLALIGLTN